MELFEKLEILADAAKYDASCASSSTVKRVSTSGTGLGSTGGTGICHAYAPDGRCISLLKILLTNFCQYECHYCVNRNSSNVPRARFSVTEVVGLTLDFYKRNYIEGLFLSSGVIRSPDYTMEQLVEVARTLREDHDFRGYIHLKTIPDADGELLTRAGRFADRLSINMELPTRAGLSVMAPEKDHRSIKRSMARIRERRIEAKEVAQQSKKATNRAVRVSAPLFAPAGQSTQMIIGADSSSDGQILNVADTLYGSYQLNRVYYSAFSPIPDASSLLPSKPPPLVREHRLYQADWLIRFYGFEATEVVPEHGMLDLDIDPKLSWALRNRWFFPIDLNKASRECLLRVPGLGTRTVQRLLEIRRRQQIRFEHLLSLRARVKVAMPFFVCADYRPSTREVDSTVLKKQAVVLPQRQLSFDWYDAPGV